MEFGKRFQKKINMKEGFQCVCLPVILINSVYRKDKNYYSQVFLENYNFIITKKRCLILMTT